MYKLLFLLLLTFWIHSLPAETLLTDADSKSESITDWTVGGHAKYQFIAVAYPENSAFRGLLGSNALDNNLEIRLKFSAARDRWDFKADYQFITLYADTLQLASGLPGAPLPVNSVISDDRRWWNLTYSYGNDDKLAMIHRLDRSNLGFTTQKTAWRFGRQAIS